MPGGVFTVLLARHNGGSVPVALQAIFSTSAAAIVTLPLWIHFGDEAGAAVAVDLRATGSLMNAKSRGVATMPPPLGCDGSP